MLSLVQRLGSLLRGIMGMVPIGVPSLRKLISWVKVSLTASLHSKTIPTSRRMQIQRFLREFKIYVISLSLFTLPSPSALHTSIFQGDHSCPHGHGLDPTTTSSLVKLGNGVWYAGQEWSMVSTYRW